MATIKTMVVEKLQQEGRSTADDTIKEVIHRKMKEICKLLPDGTPEGREFADIMFKHLGEGHEKMVAVLVDKVMEVRDDLCDYPHLRQKLIGDINQ